MGILTVNKKNFGTLSDGREVSLYTVSNGAMSFSASDYGCTLTSINLPESRNSISNGKTVDVLLGFYSIMLIWGGVIFLFSVFMIAAIHSLNKEYIYLSQQEGFPYFRYILDEEIEKNKKALAGKIDLYYANLTAPEGKLGDMDDLDMPLERIEARPDGRNDLMDGI